MIEIIFLIIIGLIFGFYLTWMGLGILPSLILSLLVLLFVPFILPFLSTTFIIPLLGPIIAFIVLAICSPVFSLAFIPFIIIFACLSPVMGTPFMIQGSIILTILFVGGIILTMFGSPFITAALI